MTNFRLGEDSLDFNVVEQFLAGDIAVSISADKRARLEVVRKFVEDHINGDETHYGINTGFGRLANNKISKEKIEELQVNLIRSHAFGVGELLTHDQVRLMMLCRAHVIAMGYSGASLEVTDTLIAMINKGVTPVVPSQGSVGASGDLAPLSFLALAMMGEGEAFYKGEKYPAFKALKKAGIKPARLHAKDGLTLINGTQAMTSLAAIAITKAGRLIKAIDIVSALTIEGLKGSSSPFGEDINSVRGQKGQQKSASAMRKLLIDSKIISAHVHCSRVQDPYSLRCIPQVHGAARDAYYYALDVVSRELNSCTDNPLVFPETGRIVSGGNFHGEPLAIAMDTLSIAVAELGSISERRIEQLTDPKSEELSVLFLTPQPGLNSGFMIPHVVASSLVSENKTLAHPASVDSMPTSAGQEDHVSMGMWAARKALKIIENVEWIATIEVMAACQAIDLHDDDLRPGRGTAEAYRLVREKVEYLETDRFLMPEAHALHKEIWGTGFVSSVEDVIGKIEL